MLQMQLLALPPLILGGVGGNFHISPLFFRMKLMWQKERLIAQQLDRRMEGKGEWRAGAERTREGKGEEEMRNRGRAGGRGRRRDRKMGVHANFIILLINFSSSNPPAGTWEQIGDRDRLREHQLKQLSQIEPSVLLTIQFWQVSMRPFT